MARAKRLADCSAAGNPAWEAVISLADLAAARAAYLTSSMREPTPARLLAAPVSVLSG